MAGETNGEKEFSESAHLGTYLAFPSWLSSVQLGDMIPIGLQFQDRTCPLFIFLKQCSHLGLDTQSKMVEVCVD